MITSIFRIILGISLLFLSAVFANAYSDIEIMTAVNTVRVEHNLNKLEKNDKLYQSAKAKLSDIQSYQYWSHDNPQTGKKWLTFIRESGFYSDAGENLARGYEDTNKIISAWLNSPSHRKNLLSSKFNSYGLAVGQVNYASGPETVVVLEFGNTEAERTVKINNNFESQLLAYVNQIQWLK
jgi:uncharacterized protein YkwD